MYRVIGNVPQNFGFDMVPPTFQREPLNSYNHAPYQPNQRYSTIIIIHSNRYEPMYPAFEPNLNYSQPPMATVPACYGNNFYPNPYHHQMQAPYIAPFFEPFNGGYPMEFGAAQGGYPMEFGAAQGGYPMEFGAAQGGYPMDFGAAQGGYPMDFSVAQRGYPMDFGVVQPPSTHSPLAPVDSFYCMDFMDVADDVAPPASTSVTPRAMRTDSIENILHPPALPAGYDGRDMKKNPIQFLPALAFPPPGSSTASISVSPRKEGTGPLFRPMQLRGNFGGHNQYKRYCHGRETRSCYKL